MLESSRGTHGVVSMHAVRAAVVASMVGFGGIGNAGAMQARSADATPARLVAQAEALQAKDAAAGLALVQKALADPRMDAATHRKAIPLRCWLAADAAIGKVPAFAAGDLPDAERLGEQTVISELHACRGYARDEAGDESGAARDFEAALAAGERAGDAAAIAQASVLRGELRYELGDTARALADLQLAYRIQQQRKDRSRANYALNAIANLYADERVGEYDKALDYYRQLLAGDQAAHDEREESTAWFNIASTLEHKGDLEGAVGGYRKSLEIEMRRGDADKVASVRRAYGVALVKLGRMGEAMQLFDQALARFRRSGDDEDVAAASLSRAVAFRKLGKLQDANADLAVARGYFTRNRNLRYLEKIESEQALSYAAAGDWRDAYAALSTQLAHRDELAAQLRQETTARMRIAFDTEKTETENRALEQVNAQRAESLASTRHIAALQRVIIALSAAIMLLLGWLVVRAWRMSQRMRVLAMTDELTRLPNRRRVLEIAHQAAGASHQESAPWSVLALDIDHFKSINDQYGHDAGDKVLARVANACKGAVREYDVVGRIGGEEFLVVLPRARLREACEVAERVRRAVEALVHEDIAPGLKTTISIGVAQSEPDDSTVGSLAKRADDCLYAAKSSGRNRVVSEAPSGD